jgi:KUP system potassium uptake protein
MDHRNAFFKSIPQAVYWPLFILATLAAIVASQSLITATFSIMKQTIALGCFPRVKMVHTSADQEGQVYSPEVNYVLMVLCVAVVLGFRNAAQVGNAFGVAVLGVMFISTLLMTLVMLVIWNLPWPLVLLFLTIFGSIEGVYFTAVLNKLPEGGWVPFGFAAFFLFISLTWSYGRQKKCKYEMNHMISLNNLGALLSSAGMQRVPGICFFYTDLVDGVPPIISHYVKNVRTLHQVLIFTTFRFIPVKTVSPEERFLVGQMGFKGVYRCVARYGYLDVIDCEGDKFKNQAIQSLQSYLQSEDHMELSTVQISNGTSSDLQYQSMENPVDMYDPEDLVELQSATGHDAVHVVGKITVRTSSSTCWLGRIAINKIYAVLRLICRSAIKELQIPPANYLEVGMLYDV